jgi:hypothetical protein
MAPRPRTLRRRILRWVLILLAAVAALVVVSPSPSSTPIGRATRCARRSRRRSRSASAAPSPSARSRGHARRHRPQGHRRARPFGQEAVKIGRIRLDFKVRPLLDHHFHAETLEIDKLEIAARRGPDGQPILANLWIAEPKKDEPAGRPPWRTSASGAPSTSSRPAARSSASPRSRIDGGAAACARRAHELDSRASRPHWGQPGEPARHRGQAAHSYSQQLASAGWLRDGRNTPSVIRRTRRPVS